MYVLEALGDLTVIEIGNNWTTSISFLTLGSGLYVLIAIGRDCCLILPPPHTAMHTEEPYRPTWLVCMLQWPTIAPN